MINNQPIIEFNPKLPKLSKNESQVLKLLVEAAKLIAPVYLEQEEKLKQEGSFYPKGLSKEEIVKLAKKNPAILSPYAVVEKIDDGIIATPYHIKYAEYLQPVAEKLSQAGNISENKEFGRALKIQAQTLLDGSYEKAIEAWFKVKSTVLDISIGPADYSDDHLFSIKALYLAWVGTEDIEGTIRLNNYKTITLSARRRAFVPSERIEPKKIEAKVIDTVLFSGLMARTKFVGINLPLDVNLVEKYGAQVTLFNQPNDLRLKEQILPTFNRIFPKGFREGFSLEDIRRGYLRYVALHELSHSYLYYKNSITNLQDLFLSIYELTATILGLRLAGTLLLKDRITEKQLESMIVAFVCRSYYLMDKGKNNKFMASYALGGTIFINFMKESGALKISSGLVTINFTKIFVSLHELSYLLENLLSHGSRKDAEIFFKKYS